MLRTFLRAVLLSASCLLALVATRARAQQAEASPWMVNAYASGVFFPNTSAKISLSGERVPGASVSKPADATVTFDVGYFVLPDLAIDLYAGIPPKGAVTGAGSIKSLGTLATSWYGPAVLAVQYSLPGLGRFHPFAGVGAAYTLFLGVRDGALNHVKVPDAFGAALEAGLRYDVAPRWTLNLDVKYVALSTRISAAYETPNGNVPAVAKTQINPLIVGLGVGYRF